VNSAGTIWVSSYWLLFHTKYAWRSERKIGFGTSWVAVFGAKARLFMALKKSFWVS
jgi:hypothetical protein